MTAVSVSDQEKRAEHQPGLQTKKEEELSVPWHQNQANPWDELLTKELLVTGEAESFQFEVHPVLI